MPRLKTGDLIILPQDGLCEIIAVDGMGAMVRPLSTRHEEFETAGGVHVAFNRAKRAPFLISNESIGD